MAHAILLMIPIVQITPEFTSFMTGQSVFGKYLGLGGVMVVLCDNAIERRVTCSYDGSFRGFR